MPDISSWELAGAVGVEGGVFVVFRFVSWERVGALGSVAGMAASGVLVRNGKKSQSVVCGGGEGWWLVWRLGGGCGGCVVGVEVAVFIRRGLIMSSQRCLPALGASPGSAF